MRIAGFWGLVLLAPWLLVTPARADYGAGRIAALAGAVGVQTQGDSQTHYASLNEVVAEGDQIATAADGSVELQLDGLVLELGPDTVVALSQLNTDAINVYVAHGSVAAGRIAGSGPDRITLQGTRSVHTLETPGRYRFDCWPDSQDEWLTVRQGRASSEADVHSETLYAGQTVQFSAGGFTTLGSAMPMDAMDMALEDAWLRTANSGLGRRLSGGWVGAAALDDQGEWLEVTSVGPLWVPFFLPPGWSPYHSGHWQWNGVWGWTWVDDLAWAWAPYHYGRWIWWNQRWAWSPAGRIPVFSPASRCPPGVVAQPLPPPGRLAGVRPLIAQTPPGVAQAGNSRTLPAISPTAGGARQFAARPGTGGNAGTPGALALNAAPRSLPPIPVMRVISPPGAGNGSGVRRSVPSTAPATGTAGSTPVPVAVAPVQGMPGQANAAAAQAAPAVRAPMPQFNRPPPAMPSPPVQNAVSEPGFRRIEMPATPAPGALPRGPANFAAPGPGAPSGIRAVPVPEAPAPRIVSAPVNGPATAAPAAQAAQRRETEHEHAHERPGVNGAGRPAP